MRRRRSCNDCKRRFTTYERLASPSIKVLKRSSRSEHFDSGKIERALRRVCRDRPTVSDADVVRLARSVEAQLIDDRAKSIRSSEVVVRVLDLLRELDRIAYERLAANYIDESGNLRTDSRGASKGDSDQLGLFTDGED